MPKQDPEVQPETVEDEVADVPSPKAAEAVAARQEQSKESKRATLALLQQKKPREREIEFMLGDEPVTMLLRAISSKDYDKLITKHPPTPEQRVEGSAYNVQTFAPAVMARVIIEPEISEKEWATIWESEAWSQGELGDLFSACAGLCVQGLKVPLS